MNKVQLIGHLGNDVELKHSPNGTAVANLSIATHRFWKNKETGDRESVTEWHRVVVFGKLAQIAKEYLKKGSHVLIEGSLRTRKWTDKSNVDRWTTEVVVSGYQATLQMLDKKIDQQATTAPSVNKEDVLGAASQEPEDDIPF